MPWHFTPMHRCMAHLVGLASSHIACRPLDIGLWRTLHPTCAARMRDAQDCYIPRRNLLRDSPRPRTRTRGSPFAPRDPAAACVTSAAATSSTSFSRTAHCRCRSASPRLRALTSPSRHAARYLTLHVPVSPACRPLPADRSPLQVARRPQRPLHVARHAQRPLHAAVRRTHLCRSRPFLALPFLTTMQISYVPMACALVVFLPTTSLSTVTPRLTRSPSARAWALRYLPHARSCSSTSPTERPLRAAAAAAARRNENDTVRPSSSLKNAAEKWAPLQHTARTRGAYARHRSGVPLMMHACTWICPLHVKRARIHKYLRRTCGALVILKPRAQEESPTLRGPRTLAQAERDALESDACRGEGRCMVGIRAGVWARVRNI
ncbi:hypothetical protein GGX14DRAFT_678935 [Mycena pura]|uniref:Uncharacterized protein n=1 Tax=Mycena pura TaxID=153505 RepID=A0AAD6UTN8_9AGAR|nr:hypothetical protein GGX14DRAFT_678935 [Mycena pura]